MDTKKRTPIDRLLFVFFWKIFQTRAIPGEAHSYPE